MSNLCKSLVLLVMPTIALEQGCTTYTGRVRISGLFSLVASTESKFGFSLFKMKF